MPCTDWLRFLISYWNVCEVTLELLGPALETGSASSESLAWGRRYS